MTLGVADVCFTSARTEAVIIINSDYYFALIAAVVTITVVVSTGNSSTAIVQAGYSKRFSWKVAKGRPVTVVGAHFLMCWAPQRNCWLQKNCFLLRDRSSYCCRYLTVAASVIADSVIVAISVGYYSTKPATEKATPLNVSFRCASFFHSSKGCCCLLFGTTYSVLCSVWSRRHS